MPKDLWPKDISKAKEIQDGLRKRVEIISLKKTPEIIAGVDAAFVDDKIIAVATLYSEVRTFFQRGLSASSLP